MGHVMRPQSPGWNSQVGGGGAGGEGGEGGAGGRGSGRAGGRGGYDGGGGCNGGGDGGDGHDELVEPYNPVSSVSKRQTEAELLTYTLSPSQTKMQSPSCTQAKRSLRGDVFHGVDGQIRGALT